MGAILAEDFLTTDCTDFTDFTDDYGTRGFGGGLW
jgi:hypothetical protein